MEQINRDQKLSEGFFGRPIDDCADDCCASLDETYQSTNKTLESCNDGCCATSCENEGSHNELPKGYRDDCCATSKSKEGVVDASFKNCDEVCCAGNEVEEETIGRTCDEECCVMSDTGKEMTCESRQDKFTCCKLPQDIENSNRDKDAVLETTEVVKSGSCEECVDACCAVPMPEQENVGDSPEECGAGCCIIKEVDEKSTSKPVESCNDGCCTKSGDDLEAKSNCCEDNSGCATSNTDLPDCCDCPTIEDLPSYDDCFSDQSKCCSSTDGPCCTEKCVIAYAEYDCANSTHEFKEDSVTKEGPCSRHLQTALDTYGAMLKKAICLCKNVASSSIVRCCERKSSTTKVRQRNLSAYQTKKACSEKIKREDTRCAQICQDTTESCTSPLKVKTHVTTKSATKDLEAASQTEYVMVDVQGMTCTGCAAKMDDTLHATPGVSDIRVVFTSGRAEFKIDTATTSPPKVISAAERISGFKITRIRNEFQSLDFLMSKLAVKRFSEKSVAGIIDVEVLDKRRARVFYDPGLIGARSLLREIGDRGILAPYITPNNLTKEKKHLTTLSIETMVALIFTIPVCVFAWADIDVSEKNKAIVSLALATPVQVIAFLEFYTNAFRTLIRSRSVELDMLVVLSVTAAYVYSVVAFGYLMAGDPLHIEGFFETSTLLVSLVLLGRLLATYARIRAVDAVSMRSLQEVTTTIVENGALEQRIDARLLEHDDVFIVRAHARVPTDGVIIEGSSNVDESMVTGESAAVKKSPGSEIIAGTLNGQGVLKAKVVRLPGQNTISEIANLVDAAHASKPRVQDLADKVAGYFIPVVLTITIIVFVIQLGVSLGLRNQSAGVAVVNAITYAIAVLAISCPCAIGLAVPLVLVIGGGVAARRGLVVKSAAVTERAWSVTDVVFDKTGTLTANALQVTQLDSFGPNTLEVLGITRALVKTSNHPVSRGITDELNQPHLIEYPLKDFQEIPGKGLQANLGADIIRGGDIKWLGIDESEGYKSLFREDIAQRRIRSHETMFGVTRNNELLAIFVLDSKIKPEAAKVIKELHKRGITTHLISGDAEGPVERVGRVLRIPNIHFRQSPADKQAYIARLTSPPTSRKQKRKTVLFCGDGTNDAAAIATASIGVSVGTVSDVTSSNADIVLLGSLEGLIFLLDLSKAVYKRIVFNFIWSAVYNIFAILLAAGAFVAFRIEPAYAGLGELVSVLPVVGVAASLLLSGRKLGRRRVHEH